MSLRLEKSSNHSERVAYTVARNVSSAEGSSSVRGVAQNRAEEFMLVALDNDLRCARPGAAAGPPLARPRDCRRRGGRPQLRPARIIAAANEQVATVARRSRGRPEGETCTRHTPRRAPTQATGEPRGTRAKTRNNAQQCVTCETCTAFV
eukprot:5617227-Pleurochrysis_carterae.AAC.1